MGQLVAHIQPLCGLASRPLLGALLYVPGELFLTSPGLFLLGPVPLVILAARASPVNGSSALQPAGVLGAGSSEFKNSSPKYMEKAHKQGP